MHTCVLKLVAVSHVNYTILEDVSMKNVQKFKFVYFFLLLPIFLNAVSGKNSLKKKTKSVVLNRSNLKKTVKKFYMKLYVNCKKLAFNRFKKDALVRSFFRGEIDGGRDLHKHIKKNYPDVFKSNKKTCDLQKSCFDSRKYNQFWEHVVAERSCVSTKLEMNEPNTISLLNEATAGLDRKYRSLVKFLMTKPYGFYKKYPKFIWVYHEAFIELIEERCYKPLLAAEKYFDKSVLNKFEEFLFSSRDSEILRKYLKHDKLVNVPEKLKELMFEDLFKWTSEYRSLVKILDKKKRLIFGRVEFFLNQAAEIRAKIFNLQSNKKGLKKFIYEFRGFKFSCSEPKDKVNKQIFRYEKKKRVKKQIKKSTKKTKKNRSKKPIKKGRVVA
ncbi:hypothetical protein ACFLYU_02195 [Candidatus Dependentiae bacterium]